jgi:hypothetical protein
MKCTTSWSNPYQQACVSQPSLTPVTLVLHSTCHTFTPLKAFSKSPTLPKRPDKACLALSLPMLGAIWAVCFRQRKASSRKLRLAIKRTKRLYQPRLLPRTSLCGLAARTHKHRKDSRETPGTNTVLTILCVTGKMQTLQERLLEPCHGLSLPL